MDFGIVEHSYDLSSKGTYEKQSICSQGYDCVQIYWMGLVRMFIFLSNAKSVVGGALIDIQNSLKSRKKKSVLLVSNILCVLCTDAVVIFLAINAVHTEPSTPPWLTCCRPVLCRCWSWQATPPRTSK